MNNAAFASTATCESLTSIYLGCWGDCGDLFGASCGVVVTSVLLLDKDLVFVSAVDRI